MTAALEGVRVADFSHLIAGPYCTMILADMGAEVIKIEPPKGDATRGYTPPDLAGESPTFLSMNRNKQSVMLDLRSAEGRQVARDIVARSDVLMENFATGVMQRLGLDYETLAKFNPRLIYCSISAYGRSGRYADRAGYDAVVQAESGLMSLNGHPGGEPHKTAVAVIDIPTGMYAAHAILAALYARKDSGIGQFIDVPLFDNAASFASYITISYLVSGINPEPLGNKSPVVVPSDVFDAQDGKFYMTVAGDSVWKKLVRAMGDPPELQIADYTNNSARTRNEPKLKPLLQRLFAQAPLAQWMEKLRAAGVPAGPIRSIAEAVASPEMQERGIIGTAPHTSAGTVPNLRLPIAMSGTPLIAPRGAPVLGEHTHSVLAELLNYKPERIAELEKKTVILPKRNG
jgi:crotonobetainyl-CoA:carnitine CoA-transferase CaiB-like acyl-CoA transferase